MIPMTHSEALQEAVAENCRTEPFFAAGKDHNDVNLHPEYFERVMNFLDR